MTSNQKQLISHDIEHIYTVAQMILNSGQLTGNLDSAIKDILAVCERDFRILAKNNEGIR